MNLVHRVRRVSVLLAASAFVAFASSAHAQDISDTHLKAARTAIAAINATDVYDAILPQAAQALKQQLIQQNPDLQELIITTVDEKALALAGRRTDLEREAALAYARVFTEADLNAIAAFYVSEPGKKLLSDGPIVAREVVKAAEIWQRGIARDLAEEVGKHLTQVVGAKAKIDPSAPAEGATPAPEGGVPGTTPKK
jgi:hypothetical protein